MDQGHWVISAIQTHEIEMSCDSDIHVIIINALLAFVTLQTACSTFPLDIKLPSYFKQVSKGFDVTIKAANLHVAIFNPNNFRIWKPFNLNTLSPDKKLNLKKLDPAPGVPAQQ